MSIIKRVSQNVTLPKNTLVEVCLMCLLNILADDEDGEIVETTTKFGFNLGFAKISRSLKKIKK